LSFNREAERLNTSLSSGRPAAQSAKQAKQSTSSTCRSIRGSRTPRVHLADFAFDAKIMMGSLIAAMITFWLLVEAFVSWIKFRKTMRHY
jgi:hypothetical protein